jgi:hypothetical protein
MTKNRPSIQLFGSIFIFILTFIVVYLKYNPIFYATNDDGTISNLANGFYTGKVSNELVYTSKIYGTILMFLYDNFPDLQWHGVYIFITVLVSLTILMKEVIYNFSNKVITKIGIFLIVFNFYLVFIISPTFTMASLISGYTAVIIFYKNLLTRVNKIVVPLLLLFNSFIIRPDGFLAIAYFLIPGAFYFMYFTFRRDKIVFANVLIFIPTLLTFFYESWQLQIMQNSSKQWDNYWQFLNAFHVVDTNPSMLKMHQAIAAFQIPGLKWTNVEATLLHSVSYLDPFMFSGSQMELAKNHVLNFIGFRGLLNAEVIPTIERIWEYMQNISFLFFALLVIVTIFTLMSHQIKTSSMYLLGTLYVFFFYYYLGAVWRIPPRINIPIIFMIIIGILIMATYSKMINSRVNALAMSLSVVFIVLYQFQANGFIGLSEKLVNRQTEQKMISAELNRIDPNGIFIGQIKFGSESYSNAFVKENRFRTLDLSTGWQVFSPAWNEKVRQLGIMDGNPVPLLTYKENTYWVSDEYIGEVMAMFLNDRKLIWQGICKVGSLPKGGKVISYQLTDKQCEQ